MPSMGSTIQRTPEEPAIVALLADERVVGPAFEDELADQTLAGPVRLCHDVHVRRLVAATSTTDVRRSRTSRAAAGSLSAVPSRSVLIGDSSGRPAQCRPVASWFGQQPTGYRSGRDPRDPTVARSTVSPRSTAARSRSRSPPR